MCPWCLKYKHTVDQYNECKDKAEYMVQTYKPLITKYAIGSKYQRITQSQFDHYTLISDGLKRLVQNATK